MKIKSSYGKWLFGGARHVTDAMNKNVLRIEIVQVRRLPFTHHLRV